MARREEIADNCSASFECDVSCNVAFPHRGGLLRHHEQVHGFVPGRIRLEFSSLTASDCGASTPGRSTCSEALDSDLEQKPEGTSAVLGQGAAVPYFVEPFSPVTHGWNGMTSVDKSGSAAINVSKLEPDTDFIDSGPPIFEQRESCDHVEIYLNSRRIGYVGFVAGTLADMHLTLLLHMQIGSGCPIIIRKLLHV
ncbi:uncharacterized protein LOC144126200 [Amblyomma americanum]